MRGYVLTGLLVLAVAGAARAGAGEDDKARLRNRALALNAEGEKLYAQGQPRQALAKWQEALAIRKQALPAGHLDIAVSLNNLAAAYFVLGQADKARALHEEALAIRKQALPEGHSFIAASLSNLADAYRALGQADKARPLYEEALAIWKKARPAGHPLIAHGLNGLAGAYSDLGQVDKARPLFEEALAIRRKSLPAGDPLLAASLNNLAGAYYTLGLVDKARTLFEEALTIRKKALPAGHPDIATSLNNLANMYSELGQPDKARSLYEEALAILKKALPEGHPLIAAGQNNLAGVYFDLGQAGKARGLFEEVLAISKKALPEGHPKIAATLNNLAVIHRALGRPGPAWRCAAEACAMAADYRLRVLAGTPQRFHSPFLAGGPSLQFLLQLAEENPGLSPAQRLELLRLLAGHQALGGLTLTLRHEAALVGGNEQAATLVARLKEVRQRLADLLLQGPPARNPGVYRTLCDDLRRQQDELEQRLADRVAGYQPLRRATKVEPDRLTAALGDGAALVQLTTYRGSDEKGRQRGAWRYAALLLWRGQGGEPEVRFVPLGEAGPLDRAVRAWRAAVQKGGTAEPAATALRRRLWEPLARQLPAGVKRLVVCPEGQLALLPLGALRLESGRYLLEDFAIRYLGSARDLLPAPTLKGAAGPALLLSDPDYEAAVGTPRFRRLPGAAREARAAAALLARRGWSPDHRTGTAASEEALAGVKRPRLLYLITHGFFLEDARAAAPPGLRDLDFGEAGPRARLAPDPRLRSGLALAGANRANERAAQGISDGLLTALEVENLDLLGTELVILSACETGLGEVQVGEGVLGLRRAFQLAGAQTVVASLWRVPDTQTEQLMSDFLKRWLKGEGKAEALRQAQLELIRQLRQSADAALRDAPPLYWAGFVCHGRPD